MDGKKKNASGDKKNSVMKNVGILFLNLIGMVVLAVALVLLGMQLIRWHVDHGVEVEVPNVCKMNLDDAKAALNTKGFTLEIQHYEFEEGRLQDEVLEQSPKAGAIVKEGRKIYVVLNTLQKPKKTIPSVIDNCSLREAKARIISSGFEIEGVRKIDGELEWVNELRYNGHALSNGDAIPEGAAVTIVVGNGRTGHEDEGPEVDEEFFD